jgi:hypothetical protein
MSWSAVPDGGPVGGHKHKHEHSIARSCLGPVCHAIRLTFFKFLAGHIRLGRTRGTRARVSRLGRLSRRPGAISATFTALSSFERGERVRERDAHGETGSRLSP